MGKSTDTDQSNGQGKEFQLFVWARIIGGLVIAVVLIWGSMRVFELIHPGKTDHLSEIPYSSEPHEAMETHAPATHGTEIPHSKTMPEKTAAGSQTMSHESAKSVMPDIHGTASAENAPTGVTFVNALTSSMDYELNKRFWGWRPNDVARLTDNVNEYQLGVLEVTRRATTKLTENISRTGNTAAINKYLERAMNSFMIRADSLVVPSAESSYQEAIDNLNRYKEQLIKNEATFYTRTDNLIPLLESLVALVGSCDENLVKTKEDNGDPVSTFDADNYYYYSKGVASALLPILHAIGTDFSQVLETRNGTEILEHAIESCEHASKMKPWLFVTEGNLNGFIANHRANMATAISHARFYMGLLVITLST